MAFNLYLQWYLLVATIILWSPVQGDGQETTDKLAQRLGHDVVPIFSNDFTGQNPEEAAYFQTEAEDYRGSEDLAALRNHRLAELQSGIDDNDDSDFDELNEDDSDDKVVMRRAPGFSHSFVGKRQNPSTFNSNQLKRIPVQLFARRAPHYTHSFVGKRSTDEDDYNSIVDKSRIDIPLKSASNSEPSPFVDNIPDNGNFVRSEPSVKSNEVQSGHSVVKRDARLEKRASGFSHSFVGKRTPHFDDKFIGREEEDSFEGPPTSLGNAGNDEDESSSMTPADFWETLSANNNQDVAIDNPEKRQRRAGQNRSNYMGKRPSFTHSFVGKRTPQFGFRPFGMDEDYREISEDNFDKNENDQDESVYIPPLGISEAGSRDFDQDYDVDTLESPDSRQRRTAHNGVNLLGKRPNFSHSFVGKRAPGFGHNFVGKRAPGFGHNFVGKRSSGFGHNFVGKRAPGFGHNFVGKRAPGFGHNFVGKRAPGFGHSFVGKRAPGFGHSFVGKRAPGFGHSFVGKRAPGFGHSFVGKRAPGFGHSFVGKRAPGFGHSFVGKRAPGFGHSFVGKRAPGFGHSFVGKRAPGFGHSFVGKRAIELEHRIVVKRDADFDKISDREIDYPVDDFMVENENDDNLPEEIYLQEVPDKVENYETSNEMFNESNSELYEGESLENDDKRAPRFGHSFVGKRAPRFGHSFVGKRAPRFGHSFVGKRAPRFGHSFVGKRAPRFGHSFVGKRAPRFGHSFVGKRAPRFGHSFVGKRAPRFGHSFVGKRAPRFGHSFVGKRTIAFEQNDVVERSPSFGHSFVGKRAPKFGHSFVGKRAPRFGHSFVGKRAPRFGHSFVGKRAPRFGHSFVGKRAPRFGHSFVGKRDDVATVSEDNLMKDTFGPTEIADLVKLMQNEESDLNLAEERAKVLNSIGDSTF
uniref:Enterin n=1 Tax=Ambigolimax valentianus TaxID=1338344 RepID=A0A5H2X8M2_9EUPU|nr:enterin precursor [Ambigolimax valentianus]